MGISEKPGFPEAGFASKQSEPIRTTSPALSQRDHIETDNEWAVLEERVLIMPVDCVI